MRDVFHDELDHMAGELVAMCDLVGAAMGRATRALLNADLQAAEEVIAADADIDRRQRDLDERAITILAQQQPVATDLRVVVMTLRMSATLERMGDLARHVAKVARLRYPSSAVPGMLHPTFERMGSVAERLAQTAAHLLVSRDVSLAAELERIDDEMDGLHRALFAAMLAENWRGTVEETIDVTLLSRYYERFGDHATSIARRVVFLVTGHTEIGRSTGGTPAGVRS